MYNCKKLPLSELMTQHTAVEKISDMKNERYITLSSNGNGAHERVIKDGKYPVPFSGYRVSEGQFIYSRIDARNGAYDIIPSELDGFVVSKDFPVFDVDTSKVLPRFLLRSVLSNGFIEQVKHSSFGATNRMRIKEDVFGSYLIRIPPLDIQNSIVECLDKAQSIIKYRRDEITRLDELVKARFVEMFGSIKSNDKGWNSAKLKDIADVRGRVGWKGYKKEDLRESGPLVLGATHLTDNGDLDLSAPVYLSREKYEESPEIVLQKNDLIFTQRGNTIGKVGLVAEDIGEATINPCVLILRPLDIHPVYFKTYFVMDETKEDMWTLNSGSAQPMITQKGIGEYQLMVPPLELQNQFADFVNQVDKSKVVEMILAA